MKWLYCAAAVALGCGSPDTSKSKASTQPSQRTGGAKGSTTQAALATGPAAWLPGDWVTPKADVSERWVHIDGALIGVGISHWAGKTQFFEIMIARMGPEGVTYTAMPGGRKSVEFVGEAEAQRGFTVTNLKNSHPRSLHYRRDGAGLQVQMVGSKGTQTVSYAKANQKPAPQLESLDRTFAHDSAARGGQAWADRFEEDGAMWPLGTPRVQGGAAIAKAINAGRADGAVLRWSPTASGMSLAGDVGFTAGKYRVETAKGKTARSGVYVTVWRKNKAGVWKIAFGTGLQTSPAATATTATTATETQPPTP